MIHAGEFVALAASWCSGALLVVGSSLMRRKCTVEKVGLPGYTVDAVGLGEALWCWPVDGYDLVLIDATENPMRAVELCEHIMQSRPRQKVAVLTGDRGGRLPFRLNADAVLSGEPEGPELARALHFLLRERSGPVGTSTEG